MLPSTIVRVRNREFFTFGISRQILTLCSIIRARPDNRTRQRKVRRFPAVTALKELCSKICFLQNRAERYLTAMRVLSLRLILIDRLLPHSDDPPTRWSVVTMPFPFDWGQATIFIESRKKNPHVERDGKFRQWNIFTKKFGRSNLLTTISQFIAME